MHLSNNIPLISQDAPAMLALGERIAARRRAEQAILPAPEGWQTAKQVKTVKVVKIALAAIILIHLALAAASRFIP